MDSFSSTSARTPGSKLARALRGCRTQSRSLIHHEYYGQTLTLLTNSVLLATLGFAFWFAGAHLFTSSQVGTFSGITAAVTLLTSFSVLGLPSTLLRYLSHTENPEQLFYGSLASVALVGTTATYVAMEFVVPHLPTEIGSPYEGQRASLMMCGLVLIIGIGTLTDGGLIAVGATKTLLIKNVAGALLRISVLPLVVGHGYIGLVAAYAIGATASTVAGVAALSRHLGGKPKISCGGFGELNRHATFSASNLVANVLGIVPLGITPILIIHQAGASQAAYFAIALQVASLLNFIPSTASQTLIAQYGSSTLGRAAYLRRATKTVYVLLIPAVTFVFLASSFVMSFFGEAYRQQGTDSLRLLSLASIFGGINYVLEAALNAERKLSSFLLMEFANAASVMVLVYALLRRGINGASLGWLLAQGATSVLGIILLVASQEKRPRDTAPTVTDGTLSAMSAASELI